MTGHQAHNTFGQLGDNPPHYSPLLRPTEVIDSDENGSLGIDENPDLNDYVLSLAARNITLVPPPPPPPPPNPICTFETISFVCDPSGETTDYLWTFEVGISDADLHRINIRPWDDWGQFPGVFDPPGAILTQLSDGETGRFSLKVSNIPRRRFSWIFDVNCYDENGDLISGSPETFLRFPNCCLTYSEPQIECLPDRDGGGFEFSSTMTNRSGFEVVKILVPDVVDTQSGQILVNVEPNVIIPAAPIPDGAPLPPLELTFNGADSGYEFQLKVVLMAEDDTDRLFECCRREVPIELPGCCNKLVDYVVRCRDADGKFPLEFSFLNLDGELPAQAARAYLLPIGGHTFNPDTFLLSPSVNDLATSQVLSTLVGGAGLGEEVDFILRIEGSSLQDKPNQAIYSCEQRHTVVMSDCETDNGGGGAGGAVNFLRGDANADGFFDITDAVTTLGFLFQGREVSCLVALDSNDDEGVDVTDAIFSLGALFGGTPLPAPPRTACGSDGTPGPLDCRSFSACEPRDLGR